MATLHLISHNLSHHDELVTLIQHSLSPDDSLIFLADGIYSRCLHLFSAYRLYILDSESRFCNIADNINLIDYAGFVQLGIDHERSLSWA